MTLQLNAYLNFRGSARSAMEFYHSVLGGELEVHTFAEFHASEVPEEQNMVMHARLITESGLVLMGSDTPSRIELTPGNNFSLSLTGDDGATLRRYFDALADGGTVTMPLERAPWGDVFGMCTDKFGVQWMVSIDQAAA